MVAKDLLVFEGSGLVEAGEWYCVIGYTDF
jgi:hypothetical protein